MVCAVGNPTGSRVWGWGGAGGAVGAECPCPTLPHRCTALGLAHRWPAGLIMPLAFSRAAPGHHQGQQD